MFSKIIRARQAHRVMRISQTVQLPYQQVRFFSADAPKAAEKAAEEAPADDKKEASSVPEPTKEELEAGR